MKRGRTAAVATRTLLLGIAACDTTFEPVVFPDGPGFCGRCLHCNKHLHLAADGTPLNGATVEHIVPQTAGGTDTAENLGVACVRCNNGKGVRHDAHYKRSARAQATVAHLLEKRGQRWRPTRVVTGGPG